MFWLIHAVYCMSQERNIEIEKYNLISINNCYIVMKNIKIFQLYFKLIEILDELSSFIQLL